MIAGGSRARNPLLRQSRPWKRADKVTIIVDNPAARDNVARFGTSQGGTVTIEKKKDGIYITIEKSRSSAHVQRRHHPKSLRLGPVVVVIPSDQMGRGEEELGHILIRSFLHALTEARADRIP